MKEKQDEEERKSAETKTDDDEDEEEEDNELEETDAAESTDGTTEVRFFSVCRKCVMNTTKKNH